MKKLLIIGAGGFGREVLEWARRCPAWRSEWEIAGFLDDNPDALNRFPAIGLPVLGRIGDHEPGANEVFICAIGNPEVRARIRRDINSRGGRFTRIIHESCTIGRRVDLGEGVILCPGVVLTCDLHVGANTALNVSTAAGHDAVIGEDCQLSSFCDITGFVKVGDRVLMGSRASIIPGKSVGDDAVIGAGSVVVQNVPPGVTVFGNPARILTRHDRS